MEQLPFLKDFIIILGAAVLIIFVSRPLRLPSIVGFLLTGMLIGPNGLNFVSERAQIETFAEIGVVMLLFFIGLDFSLAQIKAIRRQFFLGGSLQIIGTCLLIFALFSIGPFDANEKILFGFLIALSSSAVILKVLADRSELESPHGRLAVGITLFQDFCIVPMILITPMLAGAEGVSFGEVLVRFLQSVAVVVLVFYVARFVMPKVLHQIAQTRVREAFLLGSLFVCLMMAAATASLGFSYALGAFIAGLIISESEYSHEVVAEIVSFRDLFTSLFFISVGMLLNLDFVASHPSTVLGISAGIFLLKALVVFLVVLGLKYSGRTAMITAISLAQVGEFSFVLAEVGKSVALLDEVFFQHFLGASIFTMIVSPPLIAFAPAFAQRAQDILPIRARAVETGTDTARPLENHVIIVGYGLNGQNIVRVVREAGIPFAILDVDGKTVRQLLRDGHPAVFGDVTRRDILNKCGVEKARLIVLAISDPQATRTGVRLARSLNPDIYIIVRTRLLSEVDELTKLGANEVIPEEFETSIEIFTRVLDQFHVPRNVINAQISIIRDENYRMLRGLPVGRTGFDRVAQLLAAGTTDTFLVSEDLEAAGKTLQELDLSARTGATLIAVVRDEKPFMNPGPDFQIEPNDILVLVGNHANMDQAFEFLSEPREPKKNDTHIRRN